MIILLTRNILSAFVGLFHLEKSINSIIIIIIHWINFLLRHIVKLWTWPRRSRYDQEEVDIYYNLLYAKCLNLFLQMNNFTYFSNMWLQSGKVILGKDTLVMKFVFKKFQNQRNLNQNVHLESSRLVTNSISSTKLEKWLRLIIYLVNDANKIKFLVYFIQE